MLLDLKGLSLGHAYFTIERSLSGGGSRQPGQVYVKMSNLLQTADGVAGRRIASSTIRIHYKTDRMERIVQILNRIKSNASPPCMQITSHDTVMAVMNLVHYYYVMPYLPLPDSFGPNPNHRRMRRDS